MNKINELKNLRKSDSRDTGRRHDSAKKEDRYNKEKDDMSEIEFKSPNLINIKVIDICYI